MAASWKMKAKLLARSRNLAFVRDALAPFDPAIRSIEWQGMRLHYRPGSSDPWMIYNHLMKPRERDEYAPPREFSLAPEAVRTVLDIGANVGATALHFSQIFPNAQIFAFEPAPDNFVVLERNIANSKRIRSFNFGLGAEDAALDLFHSDDPANFGGYSLHLAGSDPSKKVRIRIRNAATVLAELGVEKIDVVKIDTEGAEWDILTSLPEGVLRTAQYITGELHGNKDFALLEYLSRWFDVGVRKKLSSRLFNFQAVRKQGAGKA
ncbi:MAG: FkbM family methyltransferase [Betaproteobacteria bacterium]